MLPGFEGTPPIAQGAIGCVADNGVAEGCEVDPYLVGSAGFGVGFEQCEFGKAADDFVTSKSLARVQSPGLHARTPHRIAPDRPRNLALRAADPSANQKNISVLDPSSRQA